MSNVEKTGKPNIDGVNLLVSILVSYPEIGTLSFEPSNDSIKMTFAFNKLPEEELFVAFKDILESSVKSYYALEKIRKTFFEVQLDSYNGVVFLNIVRDLYSLSRGEIALITALIRENFSDILISDVDIMFMDEEGTVQEDFIDMMISRLLVNRSVDKLIGIREEGRVMVFNK